MTTNQTIDGVPRERIKRLLKTVAESMRCLALIRSEQGHTAMTQGTYDLADECEELRALLDAPAEVESADPAIERARKIESLRGAFEQRFKLDIWPVIHWLRNSGLQEKPAAQPQGEPVARHPDAIIEGVMTSVGITHAIYASTVSLKHGEQVKLYAEQPAPVVSVPERLVMTDGLHSYEYVTGHNDAIGKMLGVKP